MAYLADMPTPVIIAAHNEARLLGRCLDSLPTDVDPYIAANGCEDDTAGVARRFGANVISLEDAGKLPAIQATLKSLGERALGPVLYLDADSYPLRPHAWATRMAGSVSDRADTPLAASGPLGYIDGNPVSDVVRSAKRFIDVRRAKRGGTTHFWGNNMATNFDRSTLDAVLDLPHIWPGEDRAIEMKVQEAGGTSEQVVDFDTTVLTSSRYMLPITHIIRVGFAQARKENLQQYNQRAADGSIPLGKYMRQSKRQKARRA